MHENTQKLQTNTWWLVFARKPSAHHFWLFCCCISPIWLKNAQNKRQDPKYENLQKIETNPNNYIFHPNLFYIIFDHFVVVFCQHGWKIFRSKVEVFMHENSQKLQTNTWWLVFAPKPSAHHFWLFYCCFPPIWSKNAQNKRQDPKYENLSKIETNPK